jgi:SAM-dependent methyltransferase
VARHPPTCLTPWPGVSGRGGSWVSAADPALWDAEAPAFDEAPDHGLLDPAVRAAWRTLLVDVLPRAPADVVDLGCGTGTLALLLAEEGYAIDALDFSPAMVRLATAKLDAAPPVVRSLVTVRAGDAAQPRLAPASVDVVLCRHVLWALAQPERAVGRWVEALRPGGRLVLVEGHWSTGAGLTAQECAQVVATSCSRVEVRPLVDPLLWGRAVSDERFLVAARP